MGLLSNIFSSKEIPSYNTGSTYESFLFNVAHSAIPFFIFSNQPNRRNASFEVLLFSSQHLLQLLHSKAPRMYSEVENGYFKELFSYARNNGFDRIISINLSEFINQRFELYYQEMKNLHEIQGFVPARTIYNFYDNPLQTSPKLSHNLPKVPLIYDAIKPMKQILEHGVDLVIR